MATVLTIAPHVRDLEALQTVCWRRGWEFRAGQRTYRWFGHRVDNRPLPPGLSPLELGRCTHAIAIPGCLYEIGLIDRGTYYLPVWDDEATGGLDCALGPNGGLFWQAYLAEKTRRAAHERGHRFGRHSDALGTLRLRVVDELTRQVAHVRVRPDGATTLWDLSPFPDQHTFQYLADALGTAQPLEAAFPPCDSAVH